MNEKLALRGERTQFLQENVLRCLPTIAALFLLQTAVIKGAKIGGFHPITQIMSNEFCHLLQFHMLHVPGLIISDSIVVIKNEVLI